MTYGDVDRETDRLARILTALPGHGPVATLALTDLRIYLLFFACIKAGRALLPMNQNLSDANVRGILSVLGGISAVFADDERLGRDLGDVPVRPLDALFAMPEAVGAELTPAAGHKPLVYQTSSGSTGTPKIIPMSSDNFAHQMRVYERIGRYDPDRTHGICNDWLPKQVSSAFVMGMPTSICPVSTLTAEQIDAWMRGHDIAYLTLYVSALRIFAGIGRVFDGLDTVMTGGEVVGRAHLALFEAFTAPHATLINLYGSQETGSVAVSYQGHGAASEGGPVSIGRPLFDGALDVVDEAGLPVVGMTRGELVVRSGYNMVVDTGYPGSDRTVRRLADGAYCTADWGYRAADGQYYVLGRRDDVVKISGYNVPLSEVEAAMRAIAGVDDAAVKGVALNGATRVLSAHYEGTASEADVAEALQRALPRFMRPHYITREDRLPRTGTGKIKKGDIVFVPRTAYQPVTGQGAYSARLAQIWRALLGHDQFDETASFFNVGGDSLTSIQLALEIERVFGMRIEVRPFLDYGASIAGLARLLEQAGVRDPGPEATATARPVTVERLWRLNESILHRWAPALPGSRHFISRSHGAPGTAVFWVMQGPSEYDAIASGLGSSVPFYAARSFSGLHRQVAAGQGLTDADLYDAGTVGPTARAYVREMLQLAGSRPMVLASNCQAGRITQAMLDILHELAVPVAGVLLLNPTDALRLNGVRTHLMFGAEEYDRYCASFGAPGALPEVARLDQLAGAHGRYFEGESLHRMIGAVQELRSDSHIRISAAE